MNISLAPAPLMFAGRKKAPAKAAAPLSPPVLTGGDTEENREKAGKFLVQIFPFDQTTVGQALKNIEDIKDQLVEFFRDGADWELKNIQELIGLVQSTNPRDNQKALSYMVSIAREMGHGISMDD